MKRCYLVIKDIKNFSPEDGFVVYAESMFELVRIWQDKLFDKKSTKKGKDYFNFSEGMVIDLGEAFEATEEMDIERYDVLYRNDIHTLKQFRFREDPNDFPMN